MKDLCVFLLLRRTISFRGELAAITSGDNSQVFWGTPQRQLKGQQCQIAHPRTHQDREAPGLQPDASLP